jgi:hypothetical protein
MGNLILKVMPNGQNCELFYLSQSGITLLVIIVEVVSLGSTEQHKCNVMSFKKFITSLVWIVDRQTRKIIQSSKIIS